MLLENTIIQQFQTKILDRYMVNKRELPWRDCGKPYWVFVSEVMLQQTQVDRVIPKFLRFVKEVPDFKTLSLLENKDLLRLWSGLGFNSRALRLQQSAQIIIEKHKGKIPKNREDLLKLPGIGAYASASILAFAFNQKVPVIDTNIRRVLIWELGLDVSKYIGSSVKTKKSLEKIALLCVPEKRSNDRHHALMDYGALVATTKATGIKSLSKQSKFKGSDREVRGWIIKELISNRFVNIERIQKNFLKKNIEKIVLGLAKEGIISLGKRGNITIC